MAQDLMDELCVQFCRMNWLRFRIHDATVRIEKCESVASECGVRYSADDVRIRLDALEKELDGLEGKFDGLEESVKAVEDGIVEEITRQIPEEGTE